MPRGMKIPECGLMEKLVEILNLDLGITLYMLGDDPPNGRPLGGACLSYQGTDIQQKYDQVAKSVMKPV